MRKFFHNMLLEHPQSVNETYFEHLKFALGFSISLFVAAFAALIHALIPALCERTASGKITELSNRMHNR